MEQYAYIRVSTKEQNIDRQIEAVKPYGIKRKNIFIDYQSGKDFNRPAYRKLLRKLRKGDVIVIKSIDRLGRNYDEIIEQWRQITKKIGADIIVLDMSLLDTRNRDGNLTGTLVADLFLQILAYVAQSERDFIHQRQAEGIAIAKSKGKKLGRKPLKMPPSFEECCKQCSGNELTLMGAAAELGVSYGTFYRRYKKYRLIQGEESGEDFVENDKHASDNCDVIDYPKGRLFGYSAKAQKCKIYITFLRFNSFVHPLINADNESRVWLKIKGSLTKPAKYMFV